MGITRLRLALAANPYCRWRHRTGIPTTIRWQRRRCRAQIRNRRVPVSLDLFCWNHQFACALKLRVRYQTDNALRTLADKLPAERRNELALRDFASGRRWTFGELFAEGEKEESRPTGHRFSPGPFAGVYPSICSPPGARTGSFARWNRDNRCRKFLGRRKTAPISNALRPPAAEPRLVAFTGRTTLADAENIVATMGLRADWPNLGVISLAHSYGFSNLVLPLLLHGIPLILAPAPLPEIIRRAAEEKSITLPAVPAMWRAWHEANAIPENVRLAISAGAPLPLNWNKKFSRRTDSKSTISLVLPNAAALLTTRAPLRAWTLHSLARRCKMSIFR